MSSYIRLGFNPTTLGITSVGRPFMTSSKDHIGARIAIGEVTLLAGKEEAATLPDRIVEANQFVLIKPAAELKTKTLQTWVTVNPELLKLGQVAHTTIVGPGEEFFVTFKAAKRTDLNTLTHLFTLFQIY